MLCISSNLFVTQACLFAASVPFKVHNLLMCLTSLSLWNRDSPLLLLTQHKAVNTQLYHLTLSFL